MGIIRKLIFPATAILVIVFPLISKTNAENATFFFNGNEVLIVDNGFEFKIKAYGDTIDEVLKNAGIILGEKDVIFPVAKNTTQKIIILRAKTVYLDIYGEKKEFLTLKNKVSEVLSESGIVLSNNDLINYSLDSEVFPGIEIKIEKKPAPPPPSIQKPKVKPRPNQDSLQITKTGETQTGTASWYNHIPGNYCASLRFPKGTRLLVTNLANGKSVIVTVNDRGPFNGRIIDLERTAFSQIGSLSSGVAHVSVERIY